MIKKFFKSSSQNNYNKELEKRLESEEDIEDSLNEQEDSTQVDEKDLEANEYLNQFEDEKKRFLQKQVEAEKRRKERFKRTGRLTPPGDENSLSTQQPSSQKKAPEKSAASQKPTITQKTNGLHAEGTLLNIEDLGIGIYKERVPKKGYDIVYILLPDKVTVQGIFLNMYRREIVGKMPSFIFKEIQKTHKWSHDQIAPYFSDDSKTYLLPTPSDEQQKVKKKETKSPSQTLKDIPFGQKLIFKMGDKTWEAVYWTKDEIDYVVAHNTNGHWQLIHLDLKRFKKMNMLQFGSVLSEEELKEIHDYIKYHGD